MAAIGLLELELSIPESASLKDKRKVIRSFKDRVRNKLNVSIAEVGQQEVWNRAHIAVVTVSTDRASADQRLRLVIEIADSIPGAVVIDRMIQWL
ncbi:DUF503 domain-containing protein [bacterium]|nr:DUF503 domain-containing protein [bacterium]